MVRAISNEDVRSVLDMETTIDLVEQGFRALGEGRAVSMPRSDMILPLGPKEAYVYKVHPGLVEDFSVAALRVQSDHIQWTDDRKEKVGDARGGQYVQYVQVYDTETTEPILIYKDGFVSKMRVGATNAIAAKYLAPADATSLALLGAGRQATGQIRGFANVLDLETITVYSPTRENREAFAREWDDRIDPTVVAADAAREAVRGVDVLACASNAMAPIFDADWIEPGMYVSAIKNPEVPEAAFERVDRTVITTRQNPFGPNNYPPRGSDFDTFLEDQWVRGFDPEGAAELSEVVAGQVDVGGGDETRLFLNNLGLGMQFAAVGRHLYERAEERDLGVELDTELFLQSVW